MMNRKQKETLYQIIRFGIVGVIATLIHYVIYWLLKELIYYNIAYTIGYGLAFIANFFLSACFTFKKNATIKNGFGFGIAHFCNYFIQMVLLNIVVAIGISKDLAPIPVYAISIPINFLMVRFVFNKK